MIKNFECTKCGNCCRKLSVTLFDLEDENVPKSLIDKYKAGDEESKKIIMNRPCKHLDENNSCRIYDSKPEVCNDFPSTIIHTIVCECQGKFKKNRSLKSGGQIMTEIKTNGKV